ncbi:MULTISPECIES: sugar ABC transporter ATP-binding protein [Clostridium]
MMEDNYLLELNNISKEFPGVKALDDVTMKVSPGKVHALMGENGAGKSTLMKCLFGIYTQDSGQILLNGQNVVTNSSKDALNLGIAMIHQEIHPVKFRNVMENMWLGRLPMHGIGPFQLVDEKKMYKDTKELFKKLGLDINPNTIVENLSVSTVQQMEIAKAVSYNAKVIIMDEPTSSLTETEVGHLFRIIRDLQKTGVAIIYISHKMEEILQISDEVSVMRDGKMIGTWEAKELSIDMIIKKMVGRDLTNRFPERKNVPGEEILRVEKFTSPFPRSFKDVSFNLRKGEVLGVGGLVGAQRTEVMEAVFGLRSLESGKIFINDKEVKIKSPMDAKKHNMALLTEERRATGIFPVLSILENIVVANQSKYLSKVKILDDKLRKDDSNKSIKQLNIKTPSFRELIQNLSGGNQQKVLLARWLLTVPEILILDEPTRGIDVGAKFEIYTIITELANQGKSIIMISSEMPELLGMSDRIMVMCEGHLSGIIDGKDATEEAVMGLASKYM